MGWAKAAGGAWVCAVAVLGLVSAPAQAAEPARALARQADFRGQRAADEVKAVAHWAVARRDAHGRPFAVVDKKSAQVFVFAANGRLAGAAPALLGLARGDDSAPGVGQRVAQGITPAERTTPAGRFESEPGHNLRGEAIVWVDYTAAVAIHRLRPAPAGERRPQRLASEGADDNRISLGCIVVDDRFYDEVVASTLGRQRGVVYVLPETRDWRMEFGIGGAGVEAL